MTEKIRVIIADDHDIYLDGLEKNLVETGKVDVVARALNGKILIERAAYHLPDLVLTDLRMPGTDGVKAITAITKINKNIRCLVLSALDNNYLIVDALEAGAQGYISKDVHKSEIIEAVQTIYENVPYYCNTTTASLARLIKRSRFNPYPVSDESLFSSLERKIIHYICEEKTSQEIGSLLYTGARSIEKHRSRILKKMKVKSPIGAAIYAVKNNLYPAMDLLPER